MLLGRQEAQRVGKVSYEVKAEPEVLVLYLSVFDESGLVRRKEHGGLGILSMGLAYFVNVNELVHFLTSIQLSPSHDLALKYIFAILSKLLDNEVISGG